MLRAAPRLLADQRLTGVSPRSSAYALQSLAVLDGQFGVVGVKADIPGALRDLHDLRETSGARSDGCGLYAIFRLTSVRRVSPR